MAEVLSSRGELAAKLDEDLFKARESLRHTEDGIRSLSGRPEFNNSSTRFNRSSAQYRNFSNVPTFDQPVNTGIKRRLGSLEDANSYQPPFKRYNNDSFNDWNGNLDTFSPFDDDINDFKPAIASSVNVTVKEVKSREKAIAELKEGEKTDSKTRNKRMFGLLLGTLQKFKKEEDGKHFKEQEKRQNEIDRKLEDAKRKELMDLKREKEKLFEKRRRQQQELRRLQRKKAVIAATESQITLLRRLQNFIQTQAKPNIFFMPAKHTIRTIELQKKSEKRLEESIKQKQEELAQELKLIDDLKNDPEAEDEDASDNDNNINNVTDGLKSKIQSKSPDSKDHQENDSKLHVMNDKTVDTEAETHEDFAAHDELLNEAEKIVNAVKLIHDEDDEKPEDDEAVDEKDQTVEPTEELIVKAEH